MQANTLNSVVASIKVEPNPPDGGHNSHDLLATGYALSGLCQIQKVEVSINEGRTWFPARITYQEGRWSWTLWDARMRLPAVEKDIDTARRVIVWSRATDQNGTRQMSECDWNLRGVAYCAVGERTIEL